MNQKQNNTTPTNPLGVLVGLILCGLVSLAFPKFTHAPDVVSWVFYLVGYVLLLLGVMMACMEAFKLRQG